MAAQDDDNDDDDNDVSGLPDTGAGTTFEANALAQDDDDDDDDNGVSGLPDTGAGTTVESSSGPGTSQLFILGSLILLLAGGATVIGSRLRATR